MKIWTEKQLTKENTRIEYTKHDCVFLAIISVFFSLRNMDVYVKWFLYLGRLCGKYAKCWDRNQWQSWFLCYKWMNAMGSIPGVLECLALVRRIQRWYKFLSLRLFVFHSKPQDGWSAREMALPIHRIKFLSIFFFLLLSPLSVWETFHINLLLLLSATPQMIILNSQLFISDTYISIVGNSNTQKFSLQRAAHVRKLSFLRWSKNMAKTKIK